MRTLTSNEIHTIQGAGLLGAILVATPAATVGLFLTPASIIYGVAVGIDKGWDEGVYASLSEGVKEGINHSTWGIQQASAFVKDVYHKGTICL